MTRSLIILVALLLVSFCSFGQRKKTQTVAEVQAEMDRYDKLADKYLQCFFAGKFSASKRKSFLPFNEAVEIRLISYEGWSGPREPNDPDTVPVVIPIDKNNFAINQVKVKEQKTLNTAGIDSLTDILFNYGYTPVRMGDVYPTDSHASCYEPHNSILFLDKNGKVRYYFEVCFTCLRHKWSTAKVKNVIYCDGKYEMLRKFFASQGVIYGTMSLHNNEE